jgi:hypothetical protein
MGCKSKTFGKNIKTEEKVSTFAARKKILKTRD